MSTAQAQDFMDRFTVAKDEDHVEKRRLIVNKLLELNPELKEDFIYEGKFNAASSLFELRLNRELTEEEKAGLDLCLHGHGIRYINRVALTLDLEGLKLWLASSSIE